MPKIPPVPFQRVVVIGSSGAGKSTFARRLGAATGFPVTHIDQLFWQPGWVQTPKPSYLEGLAAVVEEDCWIIEGVNASTLDLRLPRADLLIWLERGRRGAIPMRNRSSYQMQWLRSGRWTSIGSA